MARCSMVTCVGEDGHTTARSRNVVGGVIWQAFLSSLRLQDATAGMA